jgi:small-conductance mechanosensitive channel
MASIRSDRKVGAMSDIVNWFSQYGIRVETLLGSVAILVVAGAAILTVNRTLQRLLRGLRPRIHLPPETVLQIARTASTLLWIGVAFVLLAFWGISVSGLWASFVSVAAVIGVGFLAVWTMISNITASLFITMWRPFHRGDTVELLPENLKGRAIDRNLMFTVLREGEGRALLIPNNLFFQKMFRVTTAGDRYLFEALERDELGESATANRAYGSADAKQ